MATQEPRCDFYVCFPKHWALGLGVTYPAFLDATRCKARLAWGSSDTKLTVNLQHGSSLLS